MTLDIISSFNSFSINSTDNISSIHFLFLELFTPTSSFWCSIISSFRFFDLLYSWGISWSLTVELTSNTSPMFLARNEKNFSKLSSCKCLWWSPTSSLVWNFSSQTDYIQVIIVSCPFRWFLRSRCVKILFTTFRAFRNSHIQIFS